MAENEKTWKAILGEVRAELLRRGASATVVEYALEEISKQHLEATDKLAVQKAKISALLDHINEVEVSLRGLLLVLPKP